jgi:hypothetical protein
MVRFDKAKKRSGRDEREHSQVDKRPPEKRIGGGYKPGSV